MASNDNGKIKKSLSEKLHIRAKNAASKNNAKEQKSITLPRSPIFIIAAIVFACIIVITIAFFFVNRYSFRPKGADDTMGVLRNISSQVSVADDTISSLNTYISQTVSDDNETGVRESLQECNQAVQSLDDACSIYDENKDYLGAQTNDELVSSIDSSLNKRKDVISNAKVMLYAALSVKNASSNLDSMFTEISSAATDMDDASTTISNNTSSTSAKQALKYDESAQEHLQNAKESSQKIASSLTNANIGNAAGSTATTSDKTAENANSTVNTTSTENVNIQLDSSVLTSLNSYLDKLLEAANYSIQADEALTKSNSSEAQDLQNKSTTALEQASALKSSITLDKNEFSKNLYYSVSVEGVSTFNAEEQYKQATGTINESDKVLSAYMAARS